MTTQTAPDTKLIERVRKLLALGATGSGATQAEAELAAERAREMMAQHGITMALLDAGGKESEKRVRGDSGYFAAKKWQQSIMRALAEQSFVAAELVTGSKGERNAWRLFGRESAIVTVRIMHEYLVKTVHRVVREQTGGATDEVFKTAMGERIAERVQERHHRAMQEQAREASEKRAAANHPGAASTSNALVVVLEDYAQKERDLNDDMRRGLEPGTTARRRLEDELARQQREAKKEARRAELLAAGLEEDVVWYMLMGYSEQEALKIARKPAPVVTEEQLRKSQRRSEREDAKWRERWRRQQARENQRMNSPSYRAGRVAGDSVGLDAQVGKSDTKKLT